MAFAELFLSPELLQYIVDHTNLYADQCIAALAEQNLPYSRVNEWRPLTIVELKNFLGLMFLTGLVKKPSLESYWSQEEATSTPYFSRTMARNRYQLIWRFLHFTDNQHIDASDPFHKARPVLDLLLASFKEMYKPAKDISIDEGVMLWRGRLRFRVYNPNKPVRYGLKSYILSESTTGYCYTLKPYCGVGSTLKDTVQFLIGGLEGCGYRLWMDNYYNSVDMCKLLLGHKIHSCGTLRVNRGEPPSIREVKLSDLAVGETVSRHTDDVMVLAWRDKRIVRMISTLHQDEMKTVEVRERGQSRRVAQQKPACVTDYNLFMCGVDRLDQKISYYPFMRKTVKWSSKFVVYMFQIALANAFVIYRAKNRRGRCRTFRRFILAVVNGWTRLRPEVEADVQNPPAAPGPAPQPLVPTPRGPHNRDPAKRLDPDFAGRDETI